MRILYVTLSSPFGKGEAFITQELQELIKQGHEICVCPIKPSGSTIHSGTPPLQLNARRQALISLEVLRVATSQLLSQPKIRRIIMKVLQADTTPKVWLRNLAVMPKALWIARQAREWKADHIHAHWIHMCASAAMVASEITGIPFSITAHRGDIDDNNLLAMKADKAQFVRFIADFGKRLFEQHVTPDERHRLIRLNMGVAVPEQISPYTASRRLRIACAANFIPLKSQQTLIEAASILQDRGVEITLFLAGDGPTLQDCKKLSGQLQIDAQFPGVVAHKVLLEMYRRREVDVVALSSTVEGIPVCLMEAMAYGIPIVATEVGGVPELLSGNCGLMVPPKEPEALAEALMSLIDNPERTAQMVVNGRARIQRDFDQPTIVKRLVELMSEFKTV